MSGKRRRTVARFPAGTLGQAHGNANYRLYAPRLKRGVMEKGGRYSMVLAQSIGNVAPKKLSRVH